MGMAKETDLRYVKTEMAIRSAYKALKSGPGSVKVNELCETALINKSTFYSHYETMDMLHDSICDEQTREILAECSEFPNMLTNIKPFIYQLAGVSQTYATVIRQLFNGTWDYVDHLENILSEQYPNPLSKKDKARLSFAIGGAVRTATEAFDDETRDAIAILLEQVMNCPL